LPGIDYTSWISYSRTTKKELAAMERQVASLRYLPHISLALVISDTDEVWIKSSVDSLLGQVYPRLELCICDNNSERRHVPEVLKGYAAADERIKVLRLSEKKSWSEAYNAAISMTTGEFVALLGQGDELAPEAIFKVVELLQNVRADMIYTDEDQIDISGRRSDPVFKPYWSPDLLLSTAYIGRLCVIRRSLLEAPEVFREGFEGAEEHDLTLRLSERTDRIRHLPEVLYHRRRLPETSGAGADLLRSSSRAIEDTLARRKVEATVEPGLTEGSFRLVRRVGGNPEVSMIVSFPEGVTDLSLVDNLEQQTSYPVDQVIVANVGPQERASVDHVSHSFPARALNLAAGEAKGEYLVIVDARAQVTDPGWLLEMLHQAQRQEVGAVGCKLLDSSGKLRHGGSLVEMSWLSGYPEEPVSEDGHYLPLVDHTFNFGAAPAECMMVRRAPFERVEGFDDANLPTAFYDLDLSFRLRESGLLNLYTPYARMICGGGVGAVPGQEEIEYVWTRWWEELVRSLYYQRSPLRPEYHGLDREALSVLSW
jgi:GT2 family glycosyltransferase